MSVITLDYNDLVTDIDLSDSIEAAYGHDGLGVLTVKNVPQWLEKRQRLLPLAQQLASLPEDILAKYVHEPSKFSFGWSHGKENLQGKPDFAKGSFYANPQYDRPVDDEDLINKYPSFLHQNIWPTDDLPELELAFKELGRTIVDIGVLVARQCDRYTHKLHPNYTPNRLQNIIATSRCCKARLLHYFSTSDTVSELDETEGREDDFSSWCGWHNDHGSLTGLCSAMYLDGDGNEVDNTDANSGGFELGILVMC